MKRVFQLVLLVGLTSVAATASADIAPDPNPVPMAVRCTSLSGNSCLTSGASVVCVWSGGETGVCTCEGNPLKWSCV